MYPKETDENVKHNFCVCLRNLEMESMNQGMKETKNNA